MEVMLIYKYGVTIQIISLQHRIVRVLFAIVFVVVAFVFNHAFNKIDFAPRYLQNKACIRV